jgi:hypothetical protein
MDVGGAASVVSRENKLEADSTALIRLLDTAKVSSRLELSSPCPLPVAETPE